MADAVVRTLEPYGLHAVLEVASDDAETTASGASTWLHTGALRLQSQRELKTIPAVVLSEVLLEVDGLVRGSEAAASPAPISR